MQTGPFSSSPAPPLGPPPRLPLSRCPCLPAALSGPGLLAASWAKAQLGMAAGGLGDWPVISPWAQPVEPGSLGLVASIRAPLGTPAPRQSQTEMLSPTLSGDRLEPGRTEAIWATRATIGHDGSKPVWASCPCQNPLRAQAGGVCDSPEQPPSAPSAAPPVPREPCPGGRDTQEAAPGCPLQQPPPSHHGSPSGVQPETLGVTVERSPPGLGQRVLPSQRRCLCQAPTWAHINPPLSSHSISAQPSASHSIAFP